VCVRARARVCVRVCVRVYINVLFYIFFIIYFFSFPIDCRIYYSMPSMAPHKSIRYFFATVILSRIMSYMIKFGPILIFLPLYWKMTDTPKKYIQSSSIQTNYYKITSFRMHLINLLYLQVTISLLRFYRLYSYNLINYNNSLFFNRFQ
jgi:hypothetical protein